MCGKTGDQDRSGENMRITSERGLRKLYSPAKGRAKLKQLNKLEKHSRNFIYQAPFLVISTSNLEGKLDSSPRGGNPGFVKIIDDKTIIIPDGKGNNRIDSLINITENPNVGCLFLVPGVNETLRINGRAEIRTDPGYLELFASYKNQPKSVIKIEVEELSNSWTEFEVLIHVEETTFHARAIWVNGTDKISHYRFITTTRK